MESEKLHYLHCTLVGSYADVPGRLQKEKSDFFSVNPSGDSRQIEGKDEVLVIQQPLQRISHYFKAQDFENVSISTKLIQTTHELFLTAGVKENC